MTAEADAGAGEEEGDNGQWGSGPLGDDPQRCLGPDPHSYTNSPGAAGANGLCFSNAKVRVMLAKRPHVKLTRNYQRADSIQVALAGGRGRCSCTTA